MRKGAYSIQDSADPVQKYAVITIIINITIATIISNYNTELS